jgi:hypothetical protein
MTPDAIQAALADINQTADELEKSLKLAGLVGTLFEEKRWEMVTVGGSAIEVYTSGQYMSGDIDLCGKIGVPPARIRADVMAALGATGGPRSFRLNDRWIDILGQVERMTQAPYQTVKTPFGDVTLMPVEELLVDRVFTSAYPQANDEARACAEKLMAVCIRGNVPINWAEASKMAASKEYGISQEFAAFKERVALKLSQSPAE